MRRGVNAFLCCVAPLALQALVSSAASADPEEHVAWPGENRWVPSLAITGGATFQNWDGTATSEIFEGGTGDPIALQPECNLAADPSCSPIPLSGNDIPVAPFLGGTLGLMSPALPVPGRPRLFASGEFLPTFATERAVALQGDPSCVQGPEAEPVETLCAKDETGTVRRTRFAEENVNGEGIRTNAIVDDWVYGATLGVALPASVGERRLRVQPSVSWISYAVEAEGFLVDAECDPEIRCTSNRPNPNSPLLIGFLRQPERLSSSGSRRFHGIGPGVDVEVVTGRFGPIGSSLFLGARAYYVLGDRTIRMSTSQVYDDQISPAPNEDVVEAQWAVEVDPWLFRTHVGIRFEWLGWEGRAD